MQTIKEMHFMSMKLNKTLVAVAMALGMTSMAHAADDVGHGKVHFTGSIIDAPCSIAPGSEDQTIKLGQISSTLLNGGGHSKAELFSIELQNCSIEENKNKVSVTFGGLATGNDLLAINGSAQGVGVAITQDGKPVKLGIATAEQNLVEGGTTLNFAAYVQSSGASDAKVTEGDFQSEASFILTYS